jgi:adenosylcobinamide-GDP ribazoletransferase
MTPMARSFVMSWHFLTAIPLTKGGHDPSPGELGKAMAWFPIVGVILGGVLSLTVLLLSPILSRGVVDALVIVLLIVLTRGLHQDGLADTFDGWGGGQTPERRLEIMRDARIGAMGATALILALGLRYLGLGALPDGHRLPALLCMPAVGRWAMVLGAWSAPAARADGGLGKAFVQHVSAWSVVVACVWLGGMVIVALGIVPALLSLLTVALMTIAMTAVARRLCKGVTGDTLGAINEVAEIAFLLTIPVVLR